MPNKEKAIERVADAIVLSDDRAEIEGHLSYLWDEGIQQTFKGSLQEIVTKTTKALLDSDWGQLYLRWLDENYGRE